jgi:multidrug efflux pump subunit AcrB
LGNKDTGISIEKFKGQMRKALSQSLPDATISFEPGDLVEQVLNLGSNNPIEIAVLGRDLTQSRKVANELTNKMKAISYLRDVQIATPLDYPGIKIDIDRMKAGQL